MTDLERVRDELRAGIGRKRQANIIDAHLKEDAARERAWVKRDAELVERLNSDDRVAARNEELSGLVDELARLREEKETIMAADMKDADELIAARAELARLREENDHLKSVALENNNLRRQRDAERYARSQNAMLELQAENARLRELMQAKMDGHAVCEANSDAEIDRLREERDGWAKDTAKLVAENARLLDEANDLAADVASAHNERDRLREDNTDWREELTNRNLLVNQMYQENARLRETNAGYEAWIQSWPTHAQPDQYSKMEAELASLREEKEQGTSMISALTDDLASLREALEPHNVGEYIRGLTWGVHAPNDILTWNEAYTLVVGNIRAFAAHARNALKETT